MSKFVRNTLLGILFLGNFVFAQQNQQYLVSIELQKPFDLHQFEKLEIPILHQLDKFLLGLVSPEQYTAIREMGIPCQVLDPQPDLNKYGLIHSHGNQPVAVKAAWGTVIFRLDNSVLIKNGQLPEEEVVAAGYRVARFNQHPRFLKNQSTHVPDLYRFPGRENITDLLAEINADTVRFFIQSLQDFGTRFLFAATRDSVAEWIKNQFLGMGIADVQIDSFRYSSTWQKNVVATIPGSVNPSRVFVVGGHHDSYSSGSPMTYAPGADDNASGTAATLEIARAMRAIGYQPEATVKFVTFAAEEYGLHGSYDFAQKALISGMDIALMINHDMISYTVGTPGNWRVGLNYYTGSELYRDLATQLINSFTTLLPRNGAVNASFSDSYSFWSAGFNAIYFEEYDFSPYYHSPNDVISNYNMNFCAEVIRASGALLLFSSAAPGTVQDFQLYDRGDGISLLLDWTEISDPDMAHYNIYVGMSSGVYDTSFTTLHPPYVLSGLTQNGTYYVGISAVDTLGNEGVIVERSAVPRSIPQPPQQVSDLPGTGEIQLTWHANQELDLLGYYIYRGNQLTGPYGQLNSVVLKDTAFTDNTVQSGIYYYYTVRAIDSLLNESESSDTVRSRMISLDQGILIVDETSDGDGSLFNPTDRQVDSLYSRLFLQFTITHYDLNQEGGIKLSDLGAFSTVVWQSDDFNEFPVNGQINEHLASYLQLGGNLLVSGFQPSRAFAGNSTYPAGFTAGDFLYDYLKISQAEFHPTARFSGASPLLAGYDSLAVDSSKTSVSLNYHLIKLEGITAAPDGQNNYSYGSDYAVGTPFGTLTGKPVGVEYLGADFKVIVLSFPLYYMHFSHARQLAGMIMTEKFSEVITTLDPLPPVPEKFELFPNFPNPFNPETVIVYAIARPSHVVVKVYNLIGQEIRVLKNESQPPGNYRVVWDGRNSAREAVSSGIYIYRIQAGDFTATRKMILLR